MSSSSTPDRLYKALRLRREKGWLGVLSPRALRVDDALLEHYNWRKGCAYPGYTRLCRDTGLGHDAVSEALRELEFYGRWVIHRTTRRPNVYCLPPEVVPDVPAVRYVPRARWTRRERLTKLQAKHSAGPQSGASRRLQSRASHPSGRGGRVASSRGRLDKNYAVELRENNAVELRHGNLPLQSADNPFSPVGEKPRREETIRRHRALLFSSGGGEETFTGVRRGLAVALGCSEEEAGDLLCRGVSEPHTPPMA